jgi:single-stranded-DNA-specific exonuclease
MSFKYKLRGSTLGFGNILDSILKNRDIENIRDFLNPNENHMEDEKLYDNIELAAEELIKHIKNNSVITIVVDCDADGYTSASIMYQYICKLIEKYNSKSKIAYVIHDDKKHGLDKDTMKKVVELNTNLLIIPDAASNDYEEHKSLNKKGIVIIVLDHHECEKYSEDALVVNNQLSSNVKNKTITGVGVVYKLCRLIDKRINLNLADDFLDLLTIGMIGDVCDLRNLESRFLVSQGIKQITNENNKNKLITSMIKKKSYDMKNKITIMGIAFYIVPLINSIIRNGTYQEKELMFKAFLNSDERMVDKIRGKGEVELSIQDYVVRVAERCKRKQKKIIEDGVNLSLDQINQYKLDKNGIIIVNGTGTIDENYTGLIATKIAERYQKPCMILRSKGKKLKGSGRGYEQKEIKDFKEWCNQTGLFDFAEGHGNAFGIQIDESQINNLYSLISKLELSEELIYSVDGIFNDKNFNKAIIESVASYSDIWGTTVKEPIFAIDGITINTNDIELMGKNKNTIKFKYKDIGLIKFKSSEEEYEQIIKNKGIKLTAIGKFGLNEYNGNSYPQVTIDDMKYESSEVKFRF